MPPCGNILQSCMIREVLLKNRQPVLEVTLIHGTHRVWLKKELWRRLLLTYPCFFGSLSHRGLIWGLLNQEGLNPLLRTRGTNDRAPPDLKTTRQIKFSVS